MLAQAIRSGASGQGWPPSVRAPVSLIAYGPRPQFIRLIACRSRWEVRMTTKAKPARKAGARRPARQKAPSAVSPPSHLPPPLTDEQREAAIALLRSWREGDEADEQEQRETMEILRKALNEGRLPGYERFP